MGASNNRWQPVRRAALAGLALVLAAGSAIAQTAPKSRPATAPASGTGSLRCFMLAASVANTMQQQNGPADRVSAFNTIAMFHLGRLAGAGKLPSPAQLEAELRAEQARSSAARPAALQACGDEMVRTLGGLGRGAP